MSYNLELTGSPEGDHATGFCTTHGYTLLCDWMESLDASIYPAVAAFAAEGSYTGSDVLACQLEDAFANHPPDDPDVARTADHLLDLLGAGYPGETVSVEQ